MPKLVLLSSNRNVASELQRLSGQIESHKVFSTVVRECPVSRDMTEMEGHVHESVNGSSVSLVPVMGKNTDAGLLTMQVLKTPAILLADPDGFYQWKMLRDAFPSPEILMLILTGGSSNYSNGAALGLARRVVIVGDAMPWPTALHHSVALEIVDELRKHA